MRRLLPLLALAAWLAVVAGGVLSMARPDVFFPPLFTIPGFGTVGGLLAMRRPRNPIGWLLLAMSSAPLFDRLIGLPPEVQNGIVVGGLAVVLVLFPTGSPLSPLWYAPMVLVILSWSTLGSVGSVTLASKFEVPIGVVVAAGSLLVCVAAPVARYRRATGVERSQLRWLGAVATFTGVTFGLTAIGFAFGAEWLIQSVGGFALVGFAFGVPVAILIAILRYRLYAIDRIISRTVTFAVVALVLTGIYAVPVLLIPQLLGSTSDLVTAASTLAAAAAFNPVRRRVHAGVVRYFNRSAYDAVQEVDRLAATLRERSNHGSITAGLAAVAGGALQPSTLQVWLRRA
jgi:hypothetical protein